MTAIIELIDVGVTYRNAESPSLSGASLSIAPGEIVLVAGPSGCGKSTLLRVINGLVPRAYRAEVTGTVLIDGADTTALSIREISESVGTLLQDPMKQVVGTTVLAELAFGLENRGVAPDEIRKRAEDIAARLGIEHLLSSATHELSGGQLQLVAFAGILILEPRVVVVDEPLANLDPDAAHRLLSAVHEYVRGGGAAIIVEHRVDEIVAFEPDRVIYLEDGAVAFEGDLDGFLASASPTTIKLPFATLVATHETLPEQTRQASRAGRAVPGRPDAAAVSPDEHPRLSFRGADLGYGETTILTGVDLELSKGERVAVLGRNGAGKSTLLRAAVGLVEATAGSVTLDGRTVSDLGAKELVAICGYLFQNPGQALFSNTVRAELEFGPKNLGKTADEAFTIALAALAAVALDDLPGILERSPRTLSFGQQRRLAVALALTLGPKTLILDEPTAGQDLRSSSHFLDAIWRVDGIDSVYFITHDIDLALERADRVVVVDGGRIAGDGTPAEIVHELGLWQDLLRETEYVRALRSTVGAGDAVPSIFDLARVIGSTAGTPAP
ncbi:ABC transporter ATP-binding protein [Plantibacter sp. YIM 135347]|uniref:ABC transporter ATP-binding protein n=1 Tax=Plantibacter sp. YIM 135347 TaxID=3423919 RepID=UPI003D349A45